MLPLYDAQLESYTGASERYRRMANTKALRIGIVITGADLSRGPCTMQGARVGGDQPPQ